MFQPQHRAQTTMLRSRSPRLLPPLSVLLSVLPLLLLLLLLATTAFERCHARSDADVPLPLHRQSQLHGERTTDRSLQVTNNRRYDIGAPVVRIEGLTVSMLYLVRDQIQQDDVVVRLLRGRNCDTVITEQENDYLTVDVIPDDSDNGDGTMTRVFTVKLAVDSLTVSGSRIYQKVNDGQGRLNFCVDFGLQNSFQLVQNNIVIPMTIGINVFENIGLVNLREDDDAADFNVEVFECDSDNNYIPPDRSVVKTQGSKIRICVQPDARSYSQEVRMGSIHSMDIERGGDDGQSDIYHNQNVIVPISRINNLELTSIQCIPGERVCAVSTTLDNQFFHSEGSVRIIGRAYMQYSYGTGGGGKNRMLSLSHDRTDNDQQSHRQQHRHVPLSRSLQAGTENDYRVPGTFAGEKPFVISLKIQPTDTEYRADAYLCDGRNLPSPFTKRMHRSGDVIRVCIEPNNDAKEFSVYINSLSNFRLERRDENKVPTQVVIDKDGNVAGANEKSKLNNPLTTLAYCAEGSTVCVFRTKLERHLFRTNGTLTVVGDAELQFGTTTKQAATTISRRLRSLFSGRSLQDSGDNDAAGSNGADRDLAFAGKPEVRMTLRVEMDPYYIEEDDWQDVLSDWWDDSPGAAKAIYVIALLMMLLCMCCCVYFFCFQDLVDLPTGKNRRKKQNSRQRGANSSNMSVDQNRAAFGDVLGPPTALLNGSHRSLKSGQSQRSMYSRPSQQGNTRGMSSPTPSQRSMRSQLSRSQRSMQSSSAHSRRSDLSSSNHTRNTAMSSSNHSRRSSASGRQVRASDLSPYLPAPARSPHYTKSPYHRNKSYRSYDTDEDDNASRTSRQSSASASVSSQRSRRSQQSARPMLPFQED